MTSRATGSAALTYLRVPRKGPDGVLEQALHPFLPPDEKFKALFQERPEDFQRQTADGHAPCAPARYPTPAPPT